MPILKITTMSIFLLTLASCTIYEYNTLYSELAPDREDMEKVAKSIRQAEEKEDLVVVKNDN